MLFPPDSSKSFGHLPPIAESKAYAVSIVLWVAGRGGHHDRSGCIDHRCGGINHWGSRSIHNWRGSVHDRRSRVDNRGRSVVNRGWAIGLESEAKGAAVTMTIAVVVIVTVAIATMRIAAMGITAATMAALSIADADRVIAVAKAYADPKATVTGERGRTQTHYGQAS